MKGRTILGMNSWILWLFKINIIQFYYMFHFLTNYKTSKAIMALEISEKSAESLS